MVASLRRALHWHRPLMWFTVAMVVLGVVSAIEYNADHRMLTGVRIWDKPLLFSVSFALYAVTLAWLISRLQRPRLRRTAHRVGTVIAVATGAEMAAIVLQVLRGQQSHFNYSTPFNALVFAAMGVFVVIIFMATVAVGIAFLIESPVADRATTWAVRLGLGISVAGMSVEFLMIIPRASQAGGSIRGAHSVGVPDGGPSLPLLGWDTTGGDLRIPHFVGLHALQMLPLLSLALTLLPLTARLSDRTRVRLVLVAAAGYTGLFALVLWQALRGQSVVHPDRWTIVGALALVAGTVLGAIVAVRADDAPSRLSDATPRQRPPIPSKV